MKNSSYRYLKNSKRIINYKQLYANKYNHSYEMDKFLEKHMLQLWKKKNKNKQKPNIKA